MEGRSAAGQAAGYHFQIQRALLSLIAGEEGASVAIETLDDIVIGGDPGGIRDFEQLTTPAGSPTPSSDCSSLPQKTPARRTRRPFVCASRRWTHGRGAS